MYSDDMNLAYLLFLRPTLTEVQLVKKAFETSTANPLKLMSDLSLLIEGLAKKFVLPTCSVDPLSCDLDGFVDPKSHLGYEAEKKIRDMKGQGLTSEGEDGFRDCCLKFLRHLFKELKLRLPNNIGILRQAALLSPSNTLKVVKESLIPLMVLLNVPAESITLIDFQWRKITLVPWEKTADVASFWSEVIRYRDASGENPFKELSEFALCVLVLPWSNAEVERVFSQVNIVKTKLRNRMTTSMANALLTVRAELRRNDKCCHDYVLPESVVKKIGIKATYTGSGTSASECQSSACSAGMSSHFRADDPDGLADDILEFE